MHARDFAIALAVSASMVTSMPALVHAREPEAADPPHVPAADDPEALAMEKRIEQAEAHFIEGRAHYNQGRYLQAAAEFERSFAAIERGETLYNIALSYEKASRPVDAIRNVRRYRALPDCEDGGTAMCAKKRAEVKETERRLLLQVGELDLVIAAGVSLREIRIDGRPVPVEDFPVLLMPDTHEVEVFGTRSGEHRRRVVELEAGRTYKLPIDPFVPPRADPPIIGPDPQPDPEAAAAAQRREQRRRAALKISFWTGVGLTIASAGTTATFGVLTARANRRHEDTECEKELQSMQCTGSMPPPVDPSLKPQLRSEFLRYKTLTNVMIGVTAAVGVTTAILGIFAFSRAPSRRGSQRWGLGPGTLVVRW